MDLPEPLIDVYPQGPVNTHCPVRIETDTLGPAVRSETESCACRISTIVHWDPFVSATLQGNALEVECFTSKKTQAWSLANEQGRSFDLPSTGLVV
jgi:hypothetical protein